MVVILCQWKRFGCWRILYKIMFYGRMFWQLTKNRQVSTRIMFCYIQMCVYMLFVFVLFVLVFVSCVFSLWKGEFNKDQEVFSIFFCLFFWIECLYLAHNGERRYQLFMSLTSNSVNGNDPLQINSANWKMPKPYIKD